MYVCRHQSSPSIGERVTFRHLFCWNDHKFLSRWCFSSSHLCLSSNAQSQSDPASEICAQHNKAVLRLMRYPGHYLLSYISYWLHCLSSLHVRTLPLTRLFLPPFGCLLCSASVSPTCTLPRVRRPRLCRSRWRLNSHGMQSASLYNYASITCSVHALISHFKSMTRTYLASLRSDPGSLPMQVPPTSLFITGFKGSMRPPTLRCLGETTWLHGGEGGVLCACTSVPPLQKQPQVLTDLASVVWRLKEAAWPCWVWSHPAAWPLARFKCCWFIKGKLCRFNESGEDWKWHSINRNCQTIKQCKQHRWTSDESGCREPFSEAAPSSLRGGSVWTAVRLWQPPRDSPLTKIRFIQIVYKLNYHIQSSIQWSFIWWQSGEG